MDIHYVSARPATAVRPAGDIVDDALARVQDGMQAALERAIRAQGPYLIDLAHTKLEQNPALLLSAGEAAGAVAAAKLRPWLIALTLSTGLIGGVMLARLVRDSKK